MPVCFAKIVRKPWPGSGRSLQFTFRFKWRRQNQSNPVENQRVTKQYVSSFKFNVGGNIFGKMSLK